jgi:CheY-like chemotaxis protein
MGIQFRDLETDFGDLIDTLVRQFLGLRIVLSSPNPRVRAQLLRMLRAAVTASIDEADSAAGPGAVWASSQYDLAVIDLPEGHQPSMDLLEALVGGEGAAAVMVIAANKELRDRAVELGAQEVIDGPVSQAELRVAVLRVLARPVILAAPAKEES